MATPRPTLLHLYLAKSAEFHHSNFLSLAWLISLLHLVLIPLSLLPILVQDPLKLSKEFLLLNLILVRAQATLTLVILVQGLALGASPLPQLLDLQILSLLLIHLYYLVLQMGL